MQWLFKKESNRLINIQSSSLHIRFHRHKEGFYPFCSIKGGNRPLQGHILIDSQRFWATSMFLMKNMLKRDKANNTSALFVPTWMHKIFNGKNRTENKLRLSCGQRYMSKQTIAYTKQSQLFCWWPKEEFVIMCLPEHTIIKLKI